jgi:choline dehydrogenase-like flavoprotein
MGGGVLAHSLADRNQRVLLLERGDLLFTTHTLNTTRPHADLSRKTGPTQVCSLLRSQATMQNTHWSIRTTTLYIRS